MAYNTKQKQLILDLFLKNKEKQFTCDEIEAELKKSGTPVGKSTVYRYVLRLQSEGRVRKFTDDALKSAKYSFVENKEECCNHLHLKCLHCGEFVHLNCHITADVTSHLIKDHKFRLDNSKTVLYGLCEKCSSIKE